MDLCDVVRLLDMQPWQMDGLVILRDLSVTVNQVAQWFILYKRPKHVPDSTSISSVFYPSETNNRGPGFKSQQKCISVFSGMYFSEVYIRTTARLYPKPIKKSVGILVMVCFKIARTYFALDIYPLKNQSTS